MSLSKAKTVQLLLGDPEAFLGQMRYIIPPAGSWSPLVSSPDKGALTFWLSKLQLKTFYTQRKALFSGGEINYLLLTTTQI